MALRWCLRRSAGSGKEPTAILNVDQSPPEKTTYDRHHRRTRHLNLEQPLPAAAEHARIFATRQIFGFF
jgi:hypothetical protein